MSNTLEKEILTAAKAVKGADLVASFDRDRSIPALWITSRGELIHETPKGFRFVTLAESVKVYRDIMGELAPDWGSVSHGSPGLENWLGLIEAKLSMSWRAEGSAKR